MINMELTGWRIKSLCENKGITVKKLQECLYVGSHQSIYNWFMGKTLPSLDNMWELSKVLETPIEAIVIDEEMIRILATCYFVDKINFNKNVLMSYVEGLSV